MKPNKSGGWLAIALAAALAAFSLGSQAQAAPPGRVNFQGVAQDAAGNMLNGPVAMTFRFYDDPAAGALLWEEVYDAAAHLPAVSVLEGLFTMALGDPAHRTGGGEPTVIGLFSNHAAVYLGVQMGADAEMAPRILVSAAPFALNADALDGKQAADFANAAHLHPGTDITSVVANATHATTADTATTATNAGHATTADTATNATNATHATSADTATNAGHATTADTATTATNAGNSDTVDGQHAADFMPASSSGTFLDTSSTPQTKAGKLTLNGTTDYGINASGPAAAGHFQNSSHTGYADVGFGDIGIDAYGAIEGGHFHGPASGQAWAGYGDVGLEAFGNTVGGYFHGPDGAAYVGYGRYGIWASGKTTGGVFNDSDNSGTASVGYGDVGIDAYGAANGGFFHGPASGWARVGYGDYGIAAAGNTAGGEFRDSNNSGVADVGVGDIGIDAYGTWAGGYFHGLASGSANVGTGDYGIFASGSAAGGLFDNPSHSGKAQLAIGEVGIKAQGSGYGAIFSSPDGVTVWSDIAYVVPGLFGTIGISSNGSKSFVQNHPYDPNQVVVYTCLEGDEVATYTRGTARLANGEARVKLGETFQWVTNPDIGLTAHLTARGKATPLAVTSISTTELVVTGSEDVAFDYIVYGLRIGFEQSGTVKPKDREAPIPTGEASAAFYGNHPQLKAFTALERFKDMAGAVSGTGSGELKTPRADALKAAILASGYQGIGKINQNEAPNPRGSAPFASPSQGVLGGSPTLASPANVPPPMPAGAPASIDGGAVSVDSRPALPCFPTSEAVEAGDVVVMDPAREGYLLRCAVAADPLVMGIAAGLGSDCGPGQPGEVISASPRVPVATFGVVPCKADATLGPIHRGDLLIASPNPGHAMKAQRPIEPGTVIGKALEPMASGTGLIKVLVMFR